MKRGKTKEEVWVFGDYREYRRNRVTLELIARARELAVDLDTRCGVVILGYQVEPYIMEYIAYGAQVVYVMDAPHLEHFLVSTYTNALCRMVEHYEPQILLIGGTDFGREFAPRVAKRLGTGLSADCMALRIDSKDKLLVKTAPAFGGRLLAEVITPEKRPQMATIRPGTFQERSPDYKATAQVIYVDPVGDEGEDPLELISVERLQDSGADLEEAEVVISGGRGMGNGDGFKNIYRLAELLNGQVGCTRPPVIQGWISEDRMIGQTGRTIRPKLLITCGISGALQYTASIQGSEFIIAIDRDPTAPIFQTADLGIVADVRDILPRLIEALEAREGKEVMTYG
jgi:electron transfer flavoprotein alpha subunit